MSEKNDTYPAPPDGWVCFFCGERFRTVGSAADHFGSHPTAKPGCLLKKVEAGEERGLLMTLRKAEAEVIRLTALLYTPVREG